MKTYIEQYKNDSQCENKDNIILVGNKCDKELGEREVTQAFIDDIVHKYDVKYFETSASKNKGVNEAFYEVIKGGMAGTT